MDHDKLPDKACALIWPIQGGAIRVRTEDYAARVAPGLAGAIFHKLWPGWSRREEMPGHPTDEAARDRAGEAWEEVLRVYYPTC